jgi:hypothetical protein
MLCHHGPELSGLHRQVLFLSGSGGLCRDSVDPVWIWCQGRTSLLRDLLCLSVSVINRSHSV